MTRTQIVNLRVGQMVRTKHTPGRFWTVTKVYVHSGGRVFELDGGRAAYRMWVGTDQIDEVLPA